MKKILPLFFSTLLYLPVNAQKLDLGANYNADIPFMRTMPKMSMNNGMGLTIAYKAWQNNPIWISSDLSTGIFAYKSMKENFTFSDGSTTETYVEYSSNLHKFLLGVNCDLGNTQQLFSGYITAQGGYAIMNAKIYIDDPNDPAGCKALVNKNTFMYGGPVYAAGGGVRFNLNQFNKSKPKRGFEHYIDIGVKYIAGGTFNYVNIKHMQDQTHGMVSASNSSNSGDTRDYTVQFVNVSTNNVHEHKVAEIYRSKFEMLNLRIGYTRRF